MADNSDKSLLQVSKSPTQLSLASCSVLSACLMVVSSLLHEVSWALSLSSLHVGHSSHSLHVGHAGQLGDGHAGHSSHSLHVGHVGQLGDGHAGHSSPSLHVGHC